MKKAWSIFAVVAVIFAVVAIGAVCELNQMASHMKLVDKCRPLLSPGARVVDWADTSRCWMSFYPDSSWNGIRVMVWNITDGTGAYQCDKMEYACRVNDGNASTVEHVYQGGNPGMPVAVHESDFTCRWLDGEDECECRGEGAYWDE